MKAINASANIIEYSNVMKHVEYCGRVCWQSEPKTDTESFIKGLIKKKHESVLEHGRICLLINGMESKEILLKLGKFRTYFVFTEINERILLSANIRTWRNLIKSGMCQMSWIFAIGDLNTLFFFDFDTGSIQYPIKEECFAFWANDYEYYHDNIEFSAHYPLSVNFIVSRKTSHQLVRERVFSFSQESTRYCNYSKDRFGNEISFIIPVRFRDKNYEFIFDQWEYAMKHSENMYFAAIKKCCIPEDAAEFLPQSTKTQLIMTGTLNQWVEFFDKRALNKTGKCAAAMLEVTEPLLHECSYKWSAIFGDQLNELITKQRKGE